MKVLLSIFAIYLLVLSAMPCLDMDQALTNTTHLQDNNKESAGIESSHNHDDEHEDYCSPLCICDCCGTISGALLQLTIYNIPKIIFFNNDKSLIPYQTDYFPNFFDKIWQPPKLLIQA